MFHFIDKRKIVFAIILSGAFWFLDVMNANAATELTITHSHAGNSAEKGGCYSVCMEHVHEGDCMVKGGCYTLPVYHVHEGTKTVKGGCYTKAVLHEHTGNETAGGGCYQATVLHSHTGNESLGGGCYTTKEYHSHSGNADKGTGCYTSPVYHSHTGSAGNGGGCYLTALYHSHIGNSVTGTGCYTSPVYHAHTGSTSIKGGCYQTPVYHVHTGNETNKSGCYTVPVYHSHTGSAGIGGGCYTAPVYHGHSGSAVTGSGCYTTPIYHDHSGNAQSGGECYKTPVYHEHVGINYHSEPNGCYTRANVRYYAQLCGYFNDRGDGMWVCSGCGDVTPKSNVPVDGTHSPTVAKTVYELGCGKEESTVDSYLLSCNKNSATVDGYSLGCGKTTSTVVGYDLNCKKTTQTIEKYALGCGKMPSTIESYSLSCGKNGQTIESYSLSCGKTTATITGYALSCGKTEQTIEKYQLGCGKTTSTVTGYSLGCGKTASTVEGYSLSCGKTASFVERYAVNCGKTEKTVEKYETSCEGKPVYALGCNKAEGEILGTIGVSETGGVLTVNAKGISLQSCVWNTGAEGASLSGVSPNTAYSCKVVFLDGTQVRAAELEILTQPAPVTQPENSGVSSIVSGGNAASQPVKVPAQEDASASESVQQGNAQITSGEENGVPETVPENNGETEKATDIGEYPEDWNAWQELWDTALEETARTQESASEVQENAAGKVQEPGYEITQVGSGKPAEALAEPETPNVQTATKKISFVSFLPLILPLAGFGLLSTYLLVSKTVVLYCYDKYQRYQRLGRFMIRKISDGYAVRIPEEKLALGTTGKYRIAVNRFMLKEQNHKCLRIETEHQNMTFALEEYVDFALQS